MTARLACPLALCLLAAATAKAQDMIGVTWSGNLYAIESQTGASTLLPGGAIGQNSLTRDSAGDLWTTTRTLLSPVRRFLTRLDPSTLTLEAVAPCGDIRAMADAGNGELFVLEFVPNNYQLLRLDTATGQETFVGATGEEIQGMTMHQGQLYAFSTANGLGTLDPNTGAFTDLGPAGAPGNIQWLATRPDGELIGGRRAFYTFDTSTGVGSKYGAGDPLVDLRGIEATGVVISYGAGCEGVELTANGSLKAGSLLTTRSTGYPSTGAVVGIAGAVIVGTSRTTYNNVALPLDLDPLLGTNGCSLYASVDASTINFTTGGITPTLFAAIYLPPAIVNETFYIQHAGIDLNGGTYWSNGIQLHVGM